jgi:hypothetical protein
MLEGFMTRPTTDIPVRNLVQSAGGIVHNCTVNDETDRFVSKHWPTFEKQKKQNNGWAKYPCVVFGILRGTDTIIKGCEERGHDYFYIDHSYWYKGQKHKNHPVFNDRIYRICKNEQSLTKIDKLDKTDYTRINEWKSKLPIEIDPWKKSGGHILILPPSLFMKRFYNMHIVLPEYGIKQGKKIYRSTTKEQLKNLDKDKAIFIDVEKNYDNDEFWEKDTIKELKKYTDRELRVRYKDSPRTFEEDLKDCWAVVSSQSTGAVDSLLKGIPSFCEDTSCALPMSITDLSKIETPFYPDNRQEWIDSLLANQYTNTEIKNGVAWNRLKDR